MKPTKEQHNYYIVDRSIVSPTLLKVVAAKRILQENQDLNVSTAVEMVGISRSAFYKYKDHIFPFYDSTQGKNLTFSFDLYNTSGTLSKVLNTIATGDANILTLNQTIPINDIANIVITIETTNMTIPIEELFLTLKRHTGLFNLRIIARES